MQWRNPVPVSQNTIFAGGVFPHPPAVAQLCTLLPPPGCFRGPFVAVDMLMDVFSKIQLPETGESCKRSYYKNAELYSLQSCASLVDN